MSAKAQVEEEEKSVDEKPEEGGWLAETKEFVKAILWAFAIAIFLRSFVIEAYKIPSSSMLPTLEIGDHIFVNKFIYGFMIPGTTIKFAQWHHPQRGDVIVFKMPLDTSKDYIKRVVGLPGDVISTQGDDVFVNGVKITDTAKGQIDIVDPGVSGCTPEAVDLYTEHLPLVPGDPQSKTVDHVIVHNPSGFGGHFAQSEWTVPADHLFAMGDNRDNSADSRTGWTVPYSFVKGRAMFIWLSWDSCGGWSHPVRWNRFGQGVP